MAFVNCKTKPKYAMTAIQYELDTDLQLGPAGTARLVLRGHLNARTATACWNELEQRLRGANIKKFEVDADGLEFCDGGGLALLRYLSMGLMTPEATVSVHGLSTGLEQLFRGFTLEDYNALRPSSSVKCHPLPEEVGSGIRQAASDFREQVEFLGNVA